MYHKRQTEISSLPAFRDEALLPSPVVLLRRSSPGIPGTGNKILLKGCTNDSAIKSKAYICPQFQYDSMKYKRILLKLSGESLLGKKGYGIDPEMLRLYAGEIKKVHDLGIQIAVVIGGGNIFRGEDASGAGIEKATGDYMGMMATLINAMAIQGACENAGIYTRLMSALKIDEVCEPFIRRRAIRHMEKGRVVILGAGIGRPFFTTDSAASLRAIEIDADVVLKGTRVDGIYSSDPEKDPTATRFQNISFDQVYERGLNVMDMTAFTLCRENDLPIIVFDMNKPDNLLRLVRGEEIGTLVTNHVV